MFTLPSLPYEYDSLEPHIDAATMHLHHEKHHAAYTKNLNDALSTHPEFTPGKAEDLLINLTTVPEDIRTKVKNNAGGYVNHNFFWTIMTPKSPAPEGQLLDALNTSFGSLDDFKAKFTASAVGHFGSGWAWLVVDHGQLVITDTSNQDSPLAMNQIPLLAVDVWEHAYYLKYQNKRADYVAAWWNVVNWPKVSELLASSK